MWEKREWKRQLNQCRNPSFMLSKCKGSPLKSKAAGKGAPWVFFLFTSVLPPFFSSFLPIYWYSVDDKILYKLGYISHTAVEIPRDYIPFTLLETCLPQESWGCEYNSWLYFSLFFLTKKIVPLVEKLTDLTIVQSEITYSKIDHKHQRFRYKEQNC